MNVFTTEQPAASRAKLSLGTRFQQRLDSALGLFSPGMQLKRMQNRARIAQLHQYAGADTGTFRGPPKPLRSPDSPLAQTDSHIMSRRSQDLGRDFPFIGHLVNQYKMYALGDIHYIPNTGRKDRNQQYRDYWREWMARADVQGRFHFIDLLQLSLAGTFYNGRHGLIHHHNTDGTFQLQSIQGYNIGNPRAVYTNPGNIQGMVIDDMGRVVAYDLYSLGINGTVRFVQRVPAIIFSCLNPVVSTDEYAAKTPLHAILNDAHDMRNVETAWMQKIKWAAYKAAVFNTPNGSPPDGDGDPNANQLDYSPSAVGGIAQSYIRHQLPGEELHGEEGFSVEMLKNENPTNNETDFLVTKLAQIASAFALPLPFVWVMMGLPGTYTRLVSEQAKRAFQQGPFGQNWLERNALNEIKRMAFLAGIVRGEIPYCDDWNKGYFMYPAHPTVDVGRESKANLEENRQGIRSMATICAEEGLYWDDVDEQLSIEALNKMDLAQNIAKEFNTRNGMQGGQEVTWRDTLPMIQSYNANPPNPTITESQPVEN